MRVLESLHFSRFLPNRPCPLSSFDNHARWRPVTHSARSRRSYGKIKDCEQSKAEVTFVCHKTRKIPLAVWSIFSILVFYFFFVFNLAFGQWQNENINWSRKSKKIWNLLIWGRGAVNLWAFRLCTVCSGPENTFQMKYRLLFLKQGLELYLDRSTSSTF